MVNALRTAPRRPPVEESEEHIADWVARQPDAMAGGRAPLWWYSLTGEEPPPGLTELRFSPLTERCKNWDQALLVAHALVGAASLAGDVAAPDTSLNGADLVQAPSSSSVGRHSTDDRELGLHL